MNNKTQRTYAAGWEDYDLIDAGGEQKLERWGNIVTIRPERQAYFKAHLSKKEWYEKAHAEFVPKGTQSGAWKILQEVPSKWKINFHDIQINLALTKFKHVGLFPEQAVNWELLKSELDSSKSLLNLFAYTGVASVVGKFTGAHVTHVDSVKQLISWARVNMEDSHLKDIRWICDDAVKFAHKEVKRGNTYDCLIMDPPAFGLGAKGERWKIEDQLPKLIKLAHSLLKENGLLIMNTYSPRVKLKEIYNEVRRSFPVDNIENTELWQKTSSGNDLFYGHLIRARK
ncbi:MAG: class I SAM-dependent methyltransferase [Lishizhenia sp.]